MSELIDYLLLANPSFIYKYIVLLLNIYIRLNNHFLNPSKKKNSKEVFSI